MPLNERPRAVIVAFQAETFKLQVANNRIPDLQAFLRPLHQIEVAADSDLKPDFLVVFMPPTVYHDWAIGRLLSCIQRLTRQRFSVHLRDLRLQDYGIPQERDVVVLIASPLGVAIPWRSNEASVARTGTLCVWDMIKDLASTNPRTSPNGAGSFIGPDFALQTELNPVRDGKRGSLIHNHDTGRRLSPGVTSLDKSAKVVRLTPTMLLPHPSMREHAPRGPHRQAC